MFKKETDMTCVGRRALIQGVAGIGLAAALPSFGQSRLPGVTKLVVGFPAGGSIDAVSRRLADALRNVVADTVIVDNRPGAGGRIAIDALRRGTGDGDQWLITPGSMLVIYPHVYKKLSYDPVRDLLPVAQIADVPLALAVGPGAPASVVDVPSYIAWVKSGTANGAIGTPAAGNITHFLAFLIGRSGGISLQYVPYRGSAPAINDLLGGQIPALVNPLTEMLPHLSSGKLRVLGVTSTQRSPFLPQVPTFVEQGHPSVVGSEWMGMFARAGTPLPLVQRMASGVAAALKTPTVVAALEGLALEPAGDSGARLARRVSEELAGWREVSKVFGFQLDE
jgi:tripartite-type tricarboxylate transporter receptor subunit TctC